MKPTNQTPNQELDELRPNLDEILDEHTTPVGHEMGGQVIIGRDKLNSLIAQAIKAERDSWINQPANEHDERIRKAERVRIIDVIKKDNRAGGVYSGLAQYTNGYDRAVKRITNLIEETT